MNLFKLFSFSFVAPAPSLTPAIIKPVNKTAQILNTAADLIEKHGLEQGTYSVTKRGMCTMTAIRKATSIVNGNDDYPYEPLNKFKRYLGLSSWSKIPVWNDQLYILPKSRVVRSLRAAARS